MKVLFFGVVLLAISLHGICQLDTATFNFVQQLYNTKKYKMAMESVNGLIGKNNTLAAYYDLRGKIHFGLENRIAAIDDFSTAIKLDPANPEFYLNRSAVYYSTQNPDLAIDDYNMALQYNGNKNDSLKYAILLNRGAAESMRRNFTAAYNDYMEVLQYDSTDFGALNNLGTVLDDLGRKDDALLVLEKVIRLYPDFKGGYINLAFNCVERGDYKKALALNNKAIALDPEEPLSFNNRGYVKFKLNDFAGALADINRSLKMYPTNSYAYRNRALVYLALKQKTKACADLNEAKRQGFTEMWGDEVANLLRKHCL